MSGNSGAESLLSAPELPLLVVTKPTMESLPAAIIQFIHEFRPLFRAEAFDGFSCLLLGLLIGEAKSGTARAAVFAPATRMRLVSHREWETLPSGAACASHL